MLTRSGRVSEKLRAPIEKPVADRYYGMRDFTVLDPDGFGVRFAQRLASRS